MAGHRKQRQRPARQEPGSAARSRLAAAVTAEQQLAAAYDVFRVAACGQAPLMRRAAESLLALIEGGGRGYGE
jgi:hypothetical protein